MWGTPTSDPDDYLKLAASIEEKHRQELVEEGERWAKYQLHSDKEITLRAGGNEFHASKILLGESITL